MSFAQHVTAIEGVDREVPGDNQESQADKGLWHPLSYDPLAPPEHVASTNHVIEPFPHMAAYKVSSTKRLGKCVLPLEY
jgi:hypothetical protein